ncbi:uncharacterized protein hyls1 isoform 2-T2 [Spinachia spinachia]
MHKTHTAYRPPEDDDQESLSSSFWSDGEQEESKPVNMSGDSHQEQREQEEECRPAEDSLQEEEEEEKKGSESFSYSEDSLQEEEECKPVGDADDSLQEEEETERVICEKESTPAAGEEDSPQEEEHSPRPCEEKPVVNHQVSTSREGSEGGHDDDDEEQCRSDSPAQSLMTSGYGTVQPEEPEGGDYRDDHTMDSRGDPSETREEEEEDRSLGWFDLGPTEPDCTGTRSPHREVDTAGQGGDKGPREKSETREHVRATEDKVDVKNCEGESGDEEEERETKERDPEDESSSNKDIKFIDSKVDFRHFEWDGNLRQRKSKRRPQKISTFSSMSSGLEERLAGLHLSSSGQSSETDRVSFSALESYIGGLTRSRSDGDLRPKPKSFIRPAMSQQTIKKTDPVAKYFKYKQLWETFTLPGDGDRRSLRSELKERLAYQPPAPKPRRTYVPNSYVVPTEKKRSALRWELRNDLASGLLPHAFRFQP